MLIWESISHSNGRRLEISKGAMGLPIGRRSVRRGYAGGRVCSPPGMAAELEETQALTSMDGGRAVVMDYAVRRSGDFLYTRNGRYRDALNFFSHREHRDHREKNQ